MASSPPPSGYTEQIDVEEEVTNTSTISKSVRIRSTFMAFAVASVLAGLFLGSIMFSGVAYDYFVPLSSTTAQILEPIVFYASCGNGGTMKGQVGIQYRTVETGSIVTYYFRTFCGGAGGETLTDFSNQLKEAYPVNSNITVWYFFNALPTTYVSNPRDAPFKNPFVWMSLVCAFLIVCGSLFLVINFLMVKCGKHESICCPRCKKCG